MDESTAPNLLDRFGHSPRRMLLLGLASLGVVILVDSLTSYEFGFSSFYVLPVLFATWGLGWRRGLAFAFLSAAIWYLVDRGSGHPYSSEYYRLWDSCNHLFAYVLVALITGRLRQAFLDVQGLGRDLERIGAELREEHRFVEQVLRGAKGGIIVHGPDLRYKVWNPYMEQLTGTPAAEVLGRRPEEVFPFLVGAGLLAGLQRTLAGEEVPPFDTPYHVAATGRSGWASNALAPLSDAQGRIAGVIVTVDDITDRKRLEETEAQARKAESLVLMAGGIAHDFNNLFQAVLHSLDIADLQARHQPEVRATLAAGKDALHRAIALSWKMNDFAGRVRLKREPVQLADLLLDWAAKVPALEGRLLLDLESAPAVAADPGKLRQVLDALLENALEAMAAAGLERGKVRLALSVDTGEDRFGAQSGGRWVAERPLAPATVCLEIRDDAPCPGAEVLERMFDPFFSTKDLGRGLGLASALGLLQAHEAGIHLLQGEDQGLVLRIHFPPGPVAGSPPVSRGPGI